MTITKDQTIWANRIGNTTFNVDTSDPTKAQLNIIETGGLTTTFVMTPADAMDLMIWGLQRLRIQATAAVTVAQTALSAAEAQLDAIDNAISAIEQEAEA